LKSPTLQDRIRLLQDHFKNGRFAKTQYLLQILAAERLSPAERALCASIGRRSGFPLQSLELLRKAVYPSPKRRTLPGARATPEELAEYASSASMLGAHREARRLFEKIPDGAYPEGIYLEANSELAIFDYDRATPLLESFLKTQPADSGLRRGAEVRLAMCLIRGREKDEQRSARLLAPFLDAGTPDITLPERMYAGQIHVEHNYVFSRDTRRTLELALELERRHPDHNSVGLMLWITLLSIHHGKNVGGQKLRLQQEKRRAIQEQYWYGLRQFDLYESFLLRNRESLLRYHFGTPFPRMRRLALERFGQEARLTDHWDWVPGFGTEETPTPIGNLPLLDTILGVFEPTGASLKNGDLLLTLLRTLASDFTTPLSEHEIHEQLYPGEPHQGETSSQRVHTVVHRLRQWLERESIPMEIESLTRAYRISPQSAIRLRVINPDRNIEELAILPPELRETEAFIRKAFSTSARFSSSELGKLQQTSSRTVVYHLKALVEAGRLIAEGAGPARRYRLKD